MKGLLIVLSGPSGVGKGTVRDALFKTDINEKQFVYSVSATTRQMREGEVDGVDYFFKSKEEFEIMIQEGRLLEYAQYVDNYYGTPLDYVEAQREAGKDVFLEIEVQGAAQVKEKVPDATFIFLAPPDLSELESRITLRGTDAPEIIQQRMEEAKKELAMMQDYDYVVTNHTVDQAVSDVRAIITAERLRVERF